MFGTETRPSTPAESGETPPHGNSRVASALVVFTTVIVIECLRAVLSLTYKVGESIGFLTAGACVVALFVAPLAAPLLRRIVPPRPLLLSMIGALGVGRLVAQLVEHPFFALMATLVAVGLLALTLVMLPYGLTCRMETSLWRWVSRSPLASTPSCAATGITCVIGRDRPDGLGVPAPRRPPGRHRDAPPGQPVRADGQARPRSVSSPFWKAAPTARLDWLINELKGASSSPGVQSR